MFLPLDRENYEYAELTLRKNSPHPPSVGKTDKMLGKIPGDPGMVWYSFFLNC